MLFSLPFISLSLSHSPSLPSDNSFPYIIIFSPFLPFYRSPFLFVDYVCIHLRLRAVISSPSGYISDLNSSCFCVFAEHDSKGREREGTRRVQLISDLPLKVDSNLPFRSPSRDTSYPIVIIKPADAT